ncbi:hypothetical protein PYK79_52520 [Streptomyces sp. ID05-04B]|uniref:hypothetical protein n=1 Tax=Streptomyces sp. ID05-04B TaxID=3028661 RepID=UPI0029C58C6B|nr:hypothetical protein [Streptomyces sp. ID05-04B]MDX5570198.1 hypothetical protein [Streptomyces sp. ID05-04B]
MPDMTQNKGTGPEDRGQAATTPAPDALTTAPDTIAGAADRTGTVDPTGTADRTGATGSAGADRAPGAAAGAAAVKPKPLRPEPGTSANDADGTGIAPGTDAGATGTGADGAGTGRTGVGGTVSSRTGAGGSTAAATRDVVDAAGRHDARGASSLLPDEECDRMATRLRHAVVGFVDGPRDAVVEADEVLEELAGRLTEAVDRRRRSLRGSWQQEDGGKAHGSKDRGPAAATAVDTEQLRLALRDYRELTERLLHL